MHISDVIIIASLVLIPWSAFGWLVVSEYMRRVEKRRITLGLPVHRRQKGPTAPFCECGIDEHSFLFLRLHILARAFGIQSYCRCGHVHETHQGFSGPNSIGQWFHGECTYNSTVVGPYRMGGCGCSRYRRSFVRLW